jgi:hypothetical protein
MKYQLLEMPLKSNTFHNTLGFCKGLQCSNNWSCWCTFVIQIRRHEGHVYSSPLANYTKAGVPKCKPDDLCCTFMKWIILLNLSHEIQRHILYQLILNDNKHKRNVWKNACLNYPWNTTWCTGDMSTWESQKRRGEAKAEGFTELVYYWGREDMCKNVGEGVFELMIEEKWW